MNKIRFPACKLREDGIVACYGNKKRNGVRNIGRLTIVQTNDNGTISIITRGDKSLQLTPKQALSFAGIITRMATRLKGKDNGHKR